MAKTTWRVIAPLHHDGKLYGAGETIALDNPTAAQLKRLGSIAGQEASSGDETPPSGTKTSGGDAKK